MTEDWDEILGFAGISEYKRFVAWMDEQVLFCKARRVDVTRNYLDTSTFEEYWFVQEATGTTWRLVKPDGPSAGLFSPV